MRVRRDVPRLRHEVCFRAVQAAFAKGKEREGFRLVQFSVMPDHLHLIVEADDKNALSRGMQGLSIRVARRLNAAIGRRGRVFADRFHASALTSPRQTHSALAYVILNARKHLAAMGVTLPDAWDDRSSSAHFDGWTRRCDLPTEGDAPVTPARGWMLRVGWRRHGLIDPCEIPGGKR